MKSAISLLAIGMLTMASQPAAAEYEGPGARAVVGSVAEAASARDDTPVELEGYLVKQLTSDKFLFSDGKTQIRVEIDQEIFPKVVVNDKTRLKIYGEVEKDFMESPEIDVSRVEILK